MCVSDTVILLFCLPNFITFGCFYFCLPLQIEDDDFNNIELPSIISDN